MTFTLFHHLKDTTFDREPYYTGIAPKGTAERLAENPKGAPSFTPLPDGSILFELCQRCVAEAPDLVERLRLEEVGPPA